jgi:hypothetical protein
MKNLKLIATVFFLLIYFTSCKDEDCVKTVKIPQIYTVGNGTYSYTDLILEVPCDVEPNSEPINIEAPKLDNFSYEIILFEYTIDTPNNIAKLQIEVKLS